MVPYECVIPHDIYIQHIRVQKQQQKQQQIKKRKATTSKQEEIAPSINPMHSTLLDFEQDDIVQVYNTATEKYDIAAQVIDIDTDEQTITVQYFDDNDTTIDIKPSHLQHIHFS